MSTLITTDIVCPAKEKVRGSCTNPDQLYRETGRVNTYQLFEVKLEKVLRKKMISEVEIVWELEDTAGTAEPFLAATINSPTSNLVLTVVLPKQLCARKAVYSERPSSSMRKNWTRRTFRSAEELRRLPSISLSCCISMSYAGNVSLISRK